MYVYAEREKEKERQRERKKKRDKERCISLFIAYWFVAVAGVLILNTNLPFDSPLNTYSTFDHPWQERHQVPGRSNTKAGQGRWKDL